MSFAFAPFILFVGSSCGLVCDEASCFDVVVLEANNSVPLKAGKWLVSVSADMLDGSTDLLGECQFVNQSNGEWTDKVCTGDAVVNQKGTLGGFDSIGSVLHPDRDFDVRRFTISVNFDGTEVQRESVAPAYDAYFPNGRQCEPVCRRSEHVFSFEPTYQN